MLTRWFLNIFCYNPSYCTEQYILQLADDQLMRKIIKIRCWLNCLQSSKCLCVQIKKIQIWIIRHYKFWLQSYIFVLIKSIRNSLKQYIFGIQKLKYWYFIPNTRMYKFIHSVWEDIIILKIIFFQLEKKTKKNVHLT